MTRMNDGLREVLESGFVLPALEAGAEPELQAWGTLGGALRERPDGQLRHERTLVLPAMRWLGLPISCVQVTLGRDSRPVESVDYPLGPAARAHEPAAFDALRVDLGARLGVEGSYETYADHGGHPASRVRAAQHFDLGGVRVGLSSFGAVRETADGPCGGSLWLRASEARLAQPFLPGFDASSEAWSRGESGGKLVRRIAVPRLQRVDTLDTAQADARIHQALRYPERRAAPQWLSERLTPAEVFHWACAGHWGLACLDFTLVFPADHRPAFEHIRMRPARGGGAAYLGLTGHLGSTWASQPGAEGLDELVEYLWELGCQLRTDEYDDV